MDQKTLDEKITNIEKHISTINAELGTIKIGFALLKQRFIFYNIIIPILIFIIGILVGRVTL